MNAAMMLVCLAGSVTSGQPGKILFEGPQIKVRVYDVRQRENRHAFHQLLHHRIDIGTNFVEPSDPKLRGDRLKDWSRLATTYYHRKSPVGVVLERYNWFPGEDNTFHADARFPASTIGMGLDPWGQLCGLWSEPPIAVSNLAAGTIASYARPAQTMHIIERIPAFVKLSLPDKGKKTLFHYTQDALDRGAFLKVLEGEPRRVFEKQRADSFYQVIVIDTFKLPVSVVHKDLMTREGIKMLISKTRDDGILCFHVSNRYYDLVPVIGSVAQDLKYAALVGHDMNDDRSQGQYTSEWVIVARKAEYLKHLKTPAGYEQALKKRLRVAESYWAPPRKIDKKYIWTDKGENSFRGLYYGDPAIGDFEMALTEFEQTIADRTGLFQPHKYSRPLHDALFAWSLASAKAMNRDPAASKNKIEKK